MRQSGIGRHKVSVEHAAHQALTMQEMRQIALVSKAAMEHFGERSTWAAAC